MSTRFAAALTAGALVALAGGGAAGAASSGDASAVAMRGIVGCTMNDEAHQDSNDKGCPVAPEPPAPEPPLPEPEIVFGPPAPFVPDQEVLGDRVVRPVLGQTVVVAAEQPGVRVRRRGSKRFELLTQAEAIPVGSTIDTTRGQVRLTSATGTGDATRQGVFYGGQFVPRQKRSQGALTVLALTGPIPACGQASAAAGRGRRIFGNARGRFRTRGRHGSATVRGTRWVTEDRCNGTLFRVKQGEVIVRDFTLGSVVRVRAGERYFAPAVRPRVEPVFTG